MARAGYLAVSALACLLTLSPRGLAASAPADYLSSIEQGVVEELNLARTQPKRYAEFLAEMKQYFSGKRFQRPGRPALITHEGVAAVEEAIRYLRSAQPAPALRPSKGLSLAARDHVGDQRDGAMGHTGGDGSEPWDRVNRYGTWQHEVAENILYGGHTARDVVSQLIIDDGVRDRQHRANIFNPGFRVVGVACGPHARFERMCVMDFAAAYAEPGGSE